jgi:3-hydroxyisobutyrate dehydrogenase-like beta-hydroxyacid dehydrogenase
MTVGFVGLGAMGLPMAKRVVQAGFETATTFHDERLAGRNDHGDARGAGLNRGRPQERRRARPGRAG